MAGGQAGRTGGRRSCPRRPAAGGGRRSRRAWRPRTARGPRGRRRRGDGYYDDYFEWYPDTEELEEILDDIEDHLQQAPDAVAELAERAICLLEEVLDDGRYGSDLPDALARAADLHLDACLAGAPDPATLAERLLLQELDRAGFRTPA